MRHSLIAALFLSLAALAAAQEKRVEGPVTVALTLTQTGAEKLKSGKKAGTVSRTVSLSKTRIGNREILAALQSRGLISETKGWSLVAVWDLSAEVDPDIGGKYHFFVRKGKKATLQSLPVPDDVLSIEPLVLAWSAKQTITAGVTQVLSGTDAHQEFSMVSFSVPDTSGELQGINSGTGRFGKASGEAEIRYLPKENKITLSGVFSKGEVSDVGVGSGSIKFGKTNFVTYPAQPPQ